jgi:hypothetical protein
MKKHSLWLHQIQGLLVVFIQHNKQTNKQTNKHKEKKERIREKTNE